MVPDAQPLAESAEPARSQASPGRRWRRAAGFILGAGILGGMSSLQVYYLAAALNRPVPACDALYWGMRGWFEWLILLPAVGGLCRRWPFTRETLTRVCWVHLGGALLFPVVHAFLSAAVSASYHLVSGWEVTVATTLEPAFGRRLPFNFVAYLAIVVGYHAWLYSRRLRERERLLEQLTLSLTQARLQALHAQLNPHFLFNTLNTVTALNFTRPEAANRMLGKLAHVLRFSLDASRETQVTLDGELTFLRHYLEIEQTRFGDRLTFEIDAPHETRSIPVPTLLLHPLVENAVRYATRHRVRPAWVRVECRREGNCLRLTVSDSGPGFASDWKVRPEQSGIGLGTTRKRIDLIAGARLGVGRSIRGGAEVQITLPVGAAHPLAEPAAAGA